MIISREIKRKTLTFPQERKSVTSLSLLEKRIEEDDIPDDDVTSFEFNKTSFIDETPELENIHSE